MSQDKKVVIHCQGGDKAPMGYSLLVENGYNNVLNYSGGINDWLKAGNPVVSGN
ncbi:rhodanese-like domain-containing protein [Terrimonas pollutisoli]|uniref:rhodanese-like domain-containing protein n=1 Tax=Terrimonas pollutisoli TaxID=3034147 RepID=UPI0023EB812A|nr:rhodanese-like domain-containing protein [Terrimonas sp. H1YJ31]